MRAMVLERPGPAESRPLRRMEFPEPAPGPGQVRLRVRACGVCRTDLHQAEGELPLTAPSRILGHQVVGVVDALGEDAGSQLRVGESDGGAIYGSEPRHGPLRDTGALLDQDPGIAIDQRVTQENTDDSFHRERMGLAVS